MINFRKDNFLAINKHHASAVRLIHSHPQFQCGGLSPCQINIFEHPGGIRKLVQVPAYFTIRLYILRNSCDWPIGNPPSQVDSAE